MKQLENLAWLYIIIVLLIAAIGLTFAYWSRIKTAYRELKFWYKAFRKKHCRHRFNNYWLETGHDENCYKCGTFLSELMDTKN